MLLAEEKEFWVRISHAVLDSITDNETRGVFLQLAVMANAIYPSSAPIPRNVSDEALAALEKSGLIELHPGDQYRVPSNDEFRSEASERGRKAVAARYARSTDVGTDVVQTYNGRSTDVLPTRTQQNIEEQRTENKEEDNRDSFPLASLTELWCEGCDKSIDDGQVVRRSGRMYHPSCVKAAS